MSVALRIGLAIFGLAILAMLGFVAELAVVRLRAMAAGGPVPPAAQPWHDLVKTTRKRRVRPEFASPLHPLWPLAACAATAGATMLLPDALLRQPVFDLPLLLGLLALGRAARVLAALDAGEGASGRHAAREALAGVWADAIRLFALFALVLAARAPDDWRHLAILFLAIPAALATLSAGAEVPGDYAGPDRTLFVTEAMLRRVLLIALALGYAAATTILRLEAVGAAIVLAAALAWGLPRKWRLRVASGMAFVALALVLGRDVPVESVAIGAGIITMALGLVRLWRRQFPVEAAVLVQAGMALAGFGIGIDFGGWLILAGLALARLAVALGGDGVMGRVVLAGLPPFGLFAGDYLVVRAAGVPLGPALGIGLALGAVLLLVPAAPASTIRRERRFAAFAVLILLALLGLAPTLVFR